MTSERLPDALESALDVILRHHRLHQRQAAEKLPTAADFYVNDLPGLPTDSRVQLYAGHLPAYDNSRSQGNDADPHLFFLLSRAKRVADRPRTIFWFNGGPGCSSFDGSMMELGPLRVVSSDGEPARLEERDVTWSEYADVIFVDQPAGTGLSYMTHGKPVGELGPAADQVVAFLQNFYKVFPELQHSDTYLAGESYAGQYVPYIADRLLQSSGTSTPLKGIMMGNPWIDPALQYPAYLEYAYAMGLVKEGTDPAARAEAVNDQCNELLEGEGKDKVLVASCEQLLNVVFPPLHEQDEEGHELCLSPYKVTYKQQCGGDFPESSGNVAAYLHENAVVDAFNAELKHTPWVQCNSTIANQMWSPESTPSVQLLPDLVDNIPVLVYAGDLDMMCNWIGLNATLSNLKWSNQQGFGIHRAEEWTVNGRAVGSWQSRDDLSFVRLSEASHMVMVEEPVAAHDMVLRFMGVDRLQAAGSAAIIPSRLGNVEPGKVVHKVTPGHSAVAVDDAEGPNTATNATAQAQQEHKDREKYYGPRRSGVLAVSVLAAVCSIFLVFRWLSRRRRQNQSWPTTGYRKVSRKQKNTAQATDLEMHDRGGEG